MQLETFVAEATGASSVRLGETVQSLWSGYGRIVRAHLEGAGRSTAILKQVAPPVGGAHPRGWDGERSHARKLRSYEVEFAFYRRWSGHCGTGCRVPACLAEATDGGNRLLLLEDLDASGFPERHSALGDDDLDGCLRWLACFHATFLGEAPEELWPVGTYWHLDTRPDELAAMPTGELRDAAAAIDARLSGCRFRSFVHGDAKVANFCFVPGGGAVAAVDFQYVGGGCGMKDLAYFLGSCLDEGDCERREGELLEAYFSHLRAALEGAGGAVDIDALEAEWRALYPLAWTDFHRFLIGWAPGHWKINRYSERLAREVIASL